MEMSTSHHPKISVIITTFNEEHNIKAVLDSVSWAEETIIVDSFSTDATISIAKKYTKRIYQRAYQGPADQKNWAIPQATHPWVLILDADERVTEELKTEIRAVISKPSAPWDAYWIGRRNFFLGSEINYSGWRNDKVIRLIKRDKCRYNNKQVHEEIETDGIQVGKLHHKLIHLTFKNTDHFLDKIRRYAKWSAMDHGSGTRTVGWFHLVFKPFFRFVKHYFVQLGFLDGKRGFIISVIMAWGVFLRYLNLLEQKN